MLGTTQLDMRPENFTLSQGSPDFDQDGQRDFYYIAHVKKGPGMPGNSEMWTMDGHAQPLSGSPPWFFHEVRDVDKDGQADALSYGPFRGFFDSDCGMDQCPAQITGPELLGHNVKSGFSFKDQNALTYREKNCKLESGSELEKFARDVACGRLAGKPTAKLITLIRDKLPSFCKRSNKCPAFDIFERWAKEPLAPHLR